MNRDEETPSPAALAGEATESAGGTLEAGDVLLMMGRSQLSSLIAWCGDSIYSHAALVADAGDLIEAAASGIRRYPLARRLQDGANYAFIDAFRPLSSDRRPIGADDMAQVLRHAQALLGVPYPVDMLATLGVILAIRGKWPVHPLARIVVREALDHLVRDNPSHMVCSEAVYRCFAECDVQPRGRLAPEIVLQPRGTEPFPDIDWRALWEEVWPLIRPQRRVSLVAVDEALRHELHPQADSDVLEAGSAVGPVSDLELVRLATAARAGLGVADQASPSQGMLEQATMASAGDLAPVRPIPDPNPKLVSPLDLATTPCHVRLGRVMQG
jgi:hypothetical protein